MKKEHLAAVAFNKKEIADPVKQDQPAGLGGKNPHTIKPPPPMPKYTVVQASVKRRLGTGGKNPHTTKLPPPMPTYISVQVGESRFRLSENFKVRVIAEPKLSGKVLITGKKGKMVKISNINKQK